MRVEPIHLDENLVERLFALIVTASKTCSTLASNCIEFIDEDNARGAFLCCRKEIANPAGADTDEHLDKLGSGHREKGNVGFACNSLGKQSFASTWWTNEQDASRDLATELLEASWLFKKLDDLDEFCFCLVNACHISKCRLGLTAHVEPRFTLAKREEAALGSCHPPAQPPEE
jgi:hypothetical protein